MISFWVICALLIIVALIIILPSLLAKEPQADLDRQKINRAVFEKKLKELEHDRERDLIDQEQFEIAHYPYNIKYPQSGVRMRVHCYFGR